MSPNSSALPKTRTLYAVFNLLHDHDDHNNDNNSHSVYTVQRYITTCNIEYGTTVRTLPVQDTVFPFSPILFQGHTNMHLLTLSCLLFSMSFLTTNNQTSIVTTRLCLPTRETPHQSSNFVLQLILSIYPCFPSHL